MSNNNFNRPIRKVNPIQSNNSLNFNNIASTVNETTNIIPSTSNYSIFPNSICSDNKSGIFFNNSNVMNINLTNNSLIQNLSQNNVMPTSNANFIQSSSTHKAVLQLPDNRFVQIAQNPNVSNQQMGGTILLQMPYRLVDQNLQNSNQNLMNKKLLVKPVMDNNIPFNYNKILTAGSNNLFVSNPNFIPNNSNNVIFNTSAMANTNLNPTFVNNNQISTSQVLNCQTASTPLITNSSDSIKNMNFQQSNINSDHHQQHHIQSNQINQPQSVLNQINLINQNSIGIMNSQHNQLINTNNLINTMSSSNMSNILTPNNIIPLDKYQEISDMLQNKNLLSKLGSTEDHVLVEFRLNNQKFQLRMTKQQKIDMEHLLVSVSNHQRQMEILQVYQAEQRKIMQQRTSVVLNHHILNQTKPICTPNIIGQGINSGTAINNTNNTNNNGMVTISPNINKSTPSTILPMNSVFVAVPQPPSQIHQPSASSSSSSSQTVLHNIGTNQNHYIDNNNSNNINKHIAINPNIASPNGVILNPRLSSPQSSILASSSIAIRKEMARESLLKRTSPLVKQQNYPISTSSASTNIVQQTFISSSTTISNPTVISTLSQSSLTLGSLSSTINNSNCHSYVTTSTVNKDPFPNANANNEMKPARSRRYNNMRKVVFEDHNAVINPDIKTPFSLDNMSDIAKRLLPYHVLDETKDDNPICHREVDRILSDSFSQLDNRLSNFKRIASSIFVNEILNHKRNENLIIKRMRLDLEKDIVECEKLSLQKSFIPANNITPLLFDEIGNAYPSSVIVKNEEKPDKIDFNKVDSVKTELLTKIEVKQEVVDFEAVSRKVINIDEDNFIEYNARRSEKDSDMSHFFNGLPTVSSSSLADLSDCIIKNPLQQSSNNIDCVSDQTIPAIIEEEEDDDVDDDDEDEPDEDGRNDEKDVNSDIEDDDDQINNRTNAQLHQSVVDTSLFNIQDISMDSLDTSFFHNWNNNTNSDENCANSNIEGGDMDITGTEIDMNTSNSNIIDCSNDNFIDNNHQQSEDPDVDAAIRSILF